MTAVFKSKAGEERVLAQYRQLLASWPIPNEQRMVKTSQGQTFVISCGPETAPPVILLHGAQSNCASWIMDMPVWAQNLRLYAVDVIGEAGLSAQVRPPLDSEAHAQWLADVLRGLNLVRPVAIHGVSLGGFLALDFAQRHPKRVSRLSLMCPAGIGRTKPFLQTNGWLLLLGRYGQRKLREKVLGPVPPTIPDAIRPLVTLMQEISENIRPRLQKVPQLSDEALGRLTMPVQCIVGGQDVLIDSAETKTRLERCVPQAEVIFVPEAPHFIRGQVISIGQFLAVAP